VLNVEIDDRMPWNLDNVEKGPSEVPKDIFVASQEITKTTNNQN